MRNKATQVRLNEWAEWVRISRLTGGPKEMRSWWAPMVTEPHMGSGASSGRRLHEPINDERATQTDAAVKALPRRPKICIWQQYIRGGTKKQKAKAYGCSEAEFYRDLGDAEQVFENILLALEKSSKTPLRRETRI